MKFLFREGNIKNIDGNDILVFDGDHDYYAEVCYHESFHNISSSLGLYDYDKLDGTDYYYIYKNRGRENVIDSNELLNSLNKILSGNLSEVVNWESLSLSLPKDKDKDDIYWDVINDVLIVRGEENLKLICKELLMNSYARFGVTRSKKIDEHFISLSTDIPIIAKVFKLNTGVRNILSR